MLGATVKTDGTLVRDEDALGVPRAATIEGPDLYAVVDLGSLGDMVSRASSMAATAS
jgi:hypothetical protein